MTFGYFKDCLRHISLIFLSTYPSFILFLFFNFILHKNRVRFYLYFLIANCLIIGFILFYISDDYFKEVFPELKILLSLFVIYSSIFINHFWLNKTTLVDSFIIFSFLLLGLSLSQNLNLIRFSDSAPFFSHYISVYYGLSLSFLMSVASHRQIIFLLFFLVLNSSGSSILVALVILIVRFYKLLIVPKHFVLGLIFAGLLTISFIVGQEQRGRHLSSIKSVDRYIISQAGFNLALNQNIFETIVGSGLGEGLKLDSYIESLPVKEYLLAEYNGKIYPRSLHNDFLRIFFGYGLIGLFIFIYLIMRVTKNNTSLRYGILMASIFSSVLYVTPLVSLIYFINASSRVSSSKAS
jgi:hypothetical protein